VPSPTQRIAVTLGVLAIYRLGCYLPMPGVDPAWLARFQGAAWATAERSSIFALGVTPIISALMLLEVARLLSSRFNAWAGASPANPRRVDRSVVAGSLLLAAGQAIGIAINLEQMSNVVAQPGLEFRLGLVATMVGSTALLAWLAAL